MSENAVYRELKKQIILLEPGIRAAGE